jgi:hypothetical protein
MAITGPDGKFSFNNLKPDSYRLSATADRLIGLEYGQRTVNGQPRLLFINAGADSEGHRTSTTRDGHCQRESSSMKTDNPPQGLQYSCFDPATTDLEGISSP